MAQGKWGWRRGGAAIATLAVGAAAMGIGRAQATTDQWWTGYGNGADNSRYFASRQIDKVNVAHLQVAWTYPFGDTGCSPIAVHGVVYGRGRSGSLVAIDAQDRQGAVGPRKHERHDQPRHQLLGERGRPRPAPDLLDEQPSCRNSTRGPASRSCPSARAASSICGSASTAATRRRIGNIQSNTPGEVFENLIIARQRPGRRLHVAARRYPRLRRASPGKLVWTFHTVPRPGEFGYDTWPKDAWNYVGGTNTWGEMTVDAASAASPTFPSARPPTISTAPTAIGANLFGTSIVALDARTGKRLLALPDGAPRPLGHGPQRGAAADHHPPEWRTPRRGGRGRQDRLALCLRSRYGRTHLADRGAARAEVRHAGRAQLADAALPDQSRRRSRSTPSRRRDISPYLPTREAAAIQPAAPGGATTRACSRRSACEDTVHMPTSNGGTLFGGAASEPRQRRRLCRRA